MVKVLALLPQREDISREEFHAHWLSPHGELACGIDTLRGYVQCHRVRPGIEALPESDYEGIAEVWFNDVETAAAMGEHPVYVQHVHPDEPNFIDTERLAFVFADEHVLRAGGRIGKDDPGLKALLLLRRAPGSSREEFAAAWAEHDEEAKAAFPAASRLIRTQARAESYAEGDPAADGFLELWWPDRSALDSDWANGGRGYVERLAEFADLDASSAFLSEEKRLLWPLAA